MPRKTMLAPSGAQSLHAFCVETELLGTLWSHRNVFTTFMASLMVRLPFSFMIRRRKLPDGAHDRRMDLPAEIEHTRKPRKGNLALMIMIAKGHAHLIGNRPFFHAADEQIRLLLYHELGQLQWVGVVNDNGALV